MLWAVFRAERHRLSQAAMEQAAEGWKRVCESQERGQRAFQGGPLLLESGHCQKVSSFGYAFSTLKYLQKLGTSLEMESKTKHRIRTKQSLE